MKVYLGADHAGFEFKEGLKAVLKTRKMKYVDLSPKKIDGDDYPNSAFLVGKRVSKEHNSRGILFCGTGAGMCIAANKVKGIRAVEAYDKYTARMSREHNDANVLCLGARESSFEKAKKIALIWLKTGFSGEERHKRRIEKIARYEDRK